MRVIFLDVDGVLNTNKFLEENLSEDPAFSMPWYCSMIDREKLSLLEQLLIAVPAAKIVLSSTWRYYAGTEMFREILFCRGIRPDLVGRLIDHTEKSAGHMSMFRAQEIKSWIKRNRPKLWVIFDDMDASSDDDPNFLRTDPNVGLTQDHIDRAIAILSAGDPDEEP